MAFQYVIIGAGQEACSAAAKLRELDPDGSILLVGSENHLPYQRPPLSKKYMTGEMEADRLLLRPADWYQQQRIDTLLNVRVEAIDPAARHISLSNEDTVPYDRLLIAAGSTPRTLPDRLGGRLGNVYTIRSLGDADRIKPRLDSGKKALVIGGGYIGLEAAAVLRSEGLDVTVVEMAERILQRVAGPATSSFMRAYHQDRGVTILEQTGLDQLKGQDGKVTDALLSNGQTLSVDLVLVGIGVEPCDQLAQDCGLDCANGVLVNEQCQTSDPAIFAAGDCTNFPLKGERVRLESVQNAIEQAECAAKNMAGHPTQYRPTPWFWSDQFDLKLQIAGLNLGYDETVVRPGTREGTQSVWYFKENQFISVDCMNDPRAYMVGKRILEAGGNVTQQQAADPNTDLKALLKSLT